MKKGNGPWGSSPNLGDAIAKNGHVGAENQNQADHVHDLPCWYARMRTRKVPGIWIVGRTDADEGGDLASEIDCRY